MEGRLLGGGVGDGKGGEVLGGGKGKGVKVGLGLPATCLGYDTYLLLLSPRSNFGSRQGQGKAFRR